MSSIEAKSAVPKENGYKPLVNELGLIEGTNFPVNFKIKVGARVALVYNICISDKLVTGSLGTVIDVLTTPGGGEVETIIVAFDDPNVGVEQRRKFQSVTNQYSDQRGCPIYKATKEYPIKCRRQRKTHGPTGKVTQFPLRLAWAFTMHKAQGTTRQ